MNTLNIPKLCGGDIELCNFFTGLDSPHGTGLHAALALLRKIDGVSGKPQVSDSVCYCPEGRAQREKGWAPERHDTAATDYSTASDAFNPQDWMRTFLPGNGGCVYIDLDHLEICLPEVLSARDHVTAWNAMLRIAARAQTAANAELQKGRKIHVMANNSDGHGNSYGSHLDFLITRRAWNNIFSRRLQYLLYLAAFQVSSIVFTGQGKVGCEGSAEGAPSAYQISQRADFIEVLAGVQTTFNRPIVNSRDEPLCGSRWGNPESPAQNMARLHVIFYDSTLCDIANLLKVGVMQIMLTMIEAEKMNPQLLLDDPVAAAHAWSRDPLLVERVPLVSGKELTAVELQLLFLEEAKAFVDAGGCEGLVPEAELIIDLWADTLLKLKAGDYTSLARRLDWVLKLSILERAMKQRPELTLASHEIKHLDHVYSALDGGLFQAVARQGAVERILSDEEIERFVSEPPADTRAWARSQLLSIAGPERIEKVDWDEITFRLKGAWPYRRTVTLANPLGFTRAKTRFLETATLDDALDVLGAEPPPVLAPALIAPRLHPRGFSTQPPKSPRTIKP